MSKDSTGVRICLHCLEPSSGDPCPRCGNDPKHYEGDNRGHLARGTVIRERYLLGRVLGDGGFGVTYLGYDLRLCVRVAIKEYLPRDFASRDPRTGEVVPYRTTESDFRVGLEGFRDEGHVLGLLQEHPYIVGVHGFEWANGTAFLVMEFVDGQPLDELLKATGAPLSEPDLREILSQLCIGLQAIHEKGILHRDLKPANLYWARERKIKILDFGAAKQLLAERSGSISAVVAPGYAPPEQYMSHGREEQGPPTDIYGLGATGYALATGRCKPPDLPESLARSMGGEVLVPPHRIRPGEISPELSQIIIKAMEVDRTKRYQSAGEMLDDLTRLSVFCQKESTCSSCSSALTANDSGRMIYPICPSNLGHGALAKEGQSTQNDLPSRLGRSVKAVIAIVMVMSIVAIAVFTATKVFHCSCSDTIRNTGAAEQVKRKATGIIWTKLSGGSFKMGEDVPENEAPVHRVTVKSYEIAKTEVTVAQYNLCVESGHCKKDIAQPLHSCNSCPVLVDWYKARRFCTEWVGGRLPSEAEWEYAARSEGRDIAYPWGNIPPDCERSVILGNFHYNVSNPKRSSLVPCRKGRAFEELQPVCSKRMGNTKQGLCDMIGNAAEWTQDWYHGNYIGAPTDGSPWQIPAGTTRVVRGGSAKDTYGDFYSLRASSRQGNGPWEIFGFRCVK